ncbi:hypothetical protein Ciccas_003460 [Cichlidogyrus casuarinus]|uniref:Uncharacterized protein n=1 Tax=Cichlidogyrus casuarinus TaxID=1844966 RepID=A0ABD2QEA3_9PLAT
MNELDKKLYAVRQITLKEIKEKFLNMKKNAKSVNEYIEEFERSLNRLKAVSVESQNSMPDVIIWMLVGKKRIAVTRIPACSLIYAEQLQHRGSNCGLLQTIKLEVSHLIKYIFSCVILAFKTFLPSQRKPYLNDKEREKNWEIPAQLRIKLWLGLEKEDYNWQDIPSEGKTCFIAETNESKFGGWKKGVMGVLEWSDNTGKQELQKNAFKLPAGWEWQGDWYVAPELSLSYKVDTGLSEYTEEIYVHESRTPATNWSKSDPAYSDLVRNPKPSPEETECPSGWEWVGEWEIDFNRPVDENGWEYALSVEMEGWVAVEKLYHNARRKRLLRTRKLKRDPNISTDAITHNLLSKNHVSPHYYKLLE